MIKSFFLDKKWAIWAYAGGLFLLLSLYAQVHMSVLINTWYRGFYDILQEATKHKVHEFYDHIMIFFKIALPYVLLAAITNYFTRLYSFRWREAITFNYIPRWNNIKKDIEGSSQRIQQDAERFARIVESLGLQVVRAMMTLVAFLPILHSLSLHVVIKPLSNISGSLVWTALVVSLGGLLLSWIVGIRLPGLEYNNQVVEAAFRKELVFGEDHGESYYRKDIPTLTELFVGLKFNYHRLFLHYGYFDLWVNLYDQCVMIVPYLVMAPGLFSGAITLGLMVQVSNAFQKVHQGFALFIHNWTTITELRSIRKRLKEFEENLNKHGVDKNE